MAALGEVAFAVVLWGSMLGVLAVFLYEVYVLGREGGWLG
jgi:hypothetical protein